MSAKKEKNSGIFTREFAELIITKKLEKTGLSYEEAKKNAKHLFVHIAQQIIQLKNDCKPKSNFVGVIETKEYPTNYCSNFGQIDFYITLNKGGAMTWTMNAQEFGFPAERDVDVARELSLEEFKDSVDVFTKSIESNLQQIKNLVVKKNPEDAEKEDEKLFEEHQKIGEMGNADVIEKALVETDMDYLDKEGVIKALHNDNKIKKAAMQTA